ncbi:MAG TPA: hypothetical protein VI758_10060 [Bacteroidota bacterium]
MHQKIAVFMLLIGVPSFLFSQNSQLFSSFYGEMLVAKFASAPFPHPLRINGHLYDSTLYRFDQHYSDSSVAMFIPDGYRPSDSVDLVFHFHGWFNNIDTAFKRYELARQFAESGKNAILIVPEGPRDAPDSFGGKLEDKDGFRRLTEDVLDYLYTMKKINAHRVGQIILSGHSGGYHVISSILARGGLTEHIREVYLFDALYGQTEKFVHWLDLFDAKLVNVYTDSGGTREETRNLIDDLDSWGMPHFEAELEQAIPHDLKKNKLVFLHTKLQHDQVMQARYTFREFLKSSSLSDR